MAINPRRCVVSSRADKRIEGSGRGFTVNDSESSGALENNKRDEAAAALLWLVKCLFVVLVVVLVVFFAQ